MLQQDPMNPESDYLLLKLKIVQRSMDPGAVQEVLALREEIAKRPAHWSRKLIFLGIASSIILYNIYSVILIPLLHLFLFIGSSALAAFLMQYRYFTGTVRSGKVEFIIFCISGVGLNLVTLLLLINLLFTPGPIQEHYCKGTWREVESASAGKNEKEIQLDVSFPERQVRYNTTIKKDEVPRCDSILLFTRLGLLGYPVVVGTELSVGKRKN